MGQSLGPRLAANIERYCRERVPAGVRLDRQAWQSGDRLNGVFDLECAGILGIHEDFFRLSLVSEGLLEQVLAAYQQMSAQARPINRERIAIYYRAFLFYLMVDTPEKNLAHLKAMLNKHYWSEIR